MRVFSFIRERQRHSLEKNHLDFLLCVKVSNIWISDDIMYLRKYLPLKRRLAALRIFMQTLQHIECMYEQYSYNHFLLWKDLKSFSVCDVWSIRRRQLSLSHMMLWYSFPQEVWRTSFSFFHRPCQFLRRVQCVPFKNTDTYPPLLPRAVWPVSFPLLTLWRPNGPATPQLLPAADIMCFWGPRWGESV